MKKIVVFASGSGSNFQSIIDATITGQIPGVIAGLITDRENIKAIDRAKKHQIPFQVVVPSQLKNESEFATSLLDVLSNFETDVIILAGYLKKIPAEVIREYEGRILNIHPSLLPRFGGKGFYGLKVHQAVVDQHEKESGCTVHVVTEEYDDGPILGQSKVEVNVDDTAESLAQKVLALEHKLYPKVISDFIKTIK
ncbi:MAG: phosphoribosylglycinamide formyltransferase [Balneolaceae bacterium]|nr:phosphoribosylglycinamide formyltransferase [Balneolaceae bacterium]